VLLQLQLHHGAGAGAVEGACGSLQSSRARAWRRGSEQVSKGLSKGGAYGASWWGPSVTHRTCPGVQHPLRRDTEAAGSGQEGEGRGGRGEEGGGGETFFCQFVY
jgi:hypothetical protein